MKQLAAIALIAFSLVPIAVAHEEKKKQSKYEVFVEKEGSLILSAYYDLVGPRVTGGTARSELIHAQEVLTGKECYALRIFHTDSEHTRRRIHSVIDRDEIDFLAKTIVRIQSRMTKIIKEKKTRTRMQYTTRSGFRFGYFHRPGDNSEVFMTIGGRTVLLKNLADAKELVAKAQTKIRELESAKAATALTSD